MTEHATLHVLVYSDDRNVRSEVITALGSHPHPDLPKFEYYECATEPVVISYLDGKHPGAKRPDLVILDGESVPAGGMGIARQIKDEIFQAPPVIVLVGRPDDAWLASWSRADATVPHPIDPMELARTVIDTARTVVTI